MRRAVAGFVLVSLMIAALAGVMNVARAAPQDTLTVGVQNDTPNLSPWDIGTNSIWKDWLWRQWVFEGLYRVNPGGDGIYPVLASGVPEPDMSGLNVAVHVRSGVTFTDGVALDATDVVFSFQVYAFNSMQSDPVLKSIVWPTPIWDRWNWTTSSWGAANPSHVGITATDAYTVVFHLRQPYSMFNYSVLTIPILPSHIWQNHLFEVDLSMYSLPGGVPVTGGTEFDFDYFGSSPSDTQATVGTGPWYLVQWTPWASLTLKVYDSYWGQGQSVTWQSIQWPFFPKNVKTMDFVIYPTLEDVAAALKNGEVHVAPWDLGRSYYNALRLDSRIGFDLSVDDGYFYLAFNMRKEPFNDLNFRKAVGYAIDKDFIVEKLLGGFGIKGQVPISPVNPGYVNSSAMTPPFDPSQAVSMLDAAGYMVGPDGWRTFPDGRPLRLSILTPGFDYDPVRAAAGMKISRELKLVGLNIEAESAAFDTIVNRAFTVADFDMFVLGWVNLGLFPELYLGDFFACASDVLLGVGSNAPGFCDPEFEAQLGIFDTEMNDTKRIQAVKDAEGILAHELPYITLYSIEGFQGYRTDVWDGWTVVQGDIFNSYSLGILGSPPVVTPPSGPLGVSLYVPAGGKAGTASHIKAYVTQSGSPASGVQVDMNSSHGGWATATTGADGYADLYFTLPMVYGLINLTASASKGADVGGASGSIFVLLPNDIAQLSLSANHAVVQPSLSTEIYARVTNRDGVPIQNVPVNMSSGLALGTVNPSSLSTDGTGLATFMYTAPLSAMIPNRNRYDFIKASIDTPTRPQVPETKNQTIAIGVENPVSDWRLVYISAISSLVVDSDPVSPIPPTSTVSIQVVDENLNSARFEDVMVEVSDWPALLVDAPIKTTDAGGAVSFTFTANTAISTPVHINFTMERAFVSMSGLCLLVTDGVTPAYASWLYMNDQYPTPNHHVVFGAEVYDQTGNLAAGQEVDVFVPYNSVGNPIQSAEPGWTFFNSIGTTYTGITDSSGQILTSFDTKSFIADDIVTLEMGVNGYGPKGAFVFGSPASTYHYQTLVEGRNKVAAVASWQMSRPVITPSNRGVALTITFHDNSGIPVPANVSVWRGTGDLRPGRGATLLGTFMTDVFGKVYANWVEPNHPFDLGIGFTATIDDSKYAVGQQIGGMPFEQYYAFLVDNATPSTPPTTTMDIGNPKYAGAAMYVSSSTPLGFLANDYSMTGINRTNYRVDNGTWLQLPPAGQFSLTSEGDHYIEYFSEDNAGNVETISARVLRVDDTPPASTINPSSATAPLGTTFSLSAVDTGSGVKVMKYSIDGGSLIDYTVPFLLTLGAHTVNYTSEDNVSNQEGVNQLQVNIVTTPPPTTTLIIGIPKYIAANTYVTSSTPLRFSVRDDAGVGINYTRYRIDNGQWVTLTSSTEFTLTGEGQHGLEWYSEDNAGRVENTNLGVLIVDNTPPTTSISQSPGRHDPGTIFAFTAADTGAGVNITQYRVDGGSWTVYTGAFTLADGGHTISYRSTDNLGNSEIMRSIEVTIEAEQPPTDGVWFGLPIWLIAAIVAIIIIVIVVTLVVFFFAYRPRKKDGSAQGLPQFPPPPPPPQGPPPPQR